MGVIPTHFGHSAARDADDCRLCRETRMAADGSASAIGDLRHVLPLSAAASLGLVLALGDGGPAGWLGAGVVTGISACAMYMWIARRRLLRSAHRAHATELRTLAQDADVRVEAVVKQLEWAVGDLAKLRTKLDQAEETIRTLTERGKELPAGASFDAVCFTWGLHLDGLRARLELQTAANSESPTRVRVTDRDGQIVAVSGMAVVSLDGNVEYELEAPIDLVVDLDDGREISYAIEALVAHEWRPVRLRDSGRRTSSAVDVHGRLSRVSRAPDTSRFDDVAHERRSALN